MYDDFQKVKLVYDINLCQHFFDDALNIGILF